MPRLFVPPESLGGERATLDRAAHRHLVKVLRLGRGDRVHLFDGAGSEIEARIETVGASSVEVSLGKRQRLPAPACTIVLLISPPRGERMDLVVQKTTELGVARIVPVTSARAMVKASPHQRSRWQSIATEASRQSGRADVPAVADLVPLAEAIAREADGASPRLMLWEGERARALGAALADGPRSVTLLVGPEGGFQAEEVRLTAAAGFVPVGLGPRILRSETAAIVGVALAQAAAGGLEWGPGNRQ
jgi:16S rRNA (uracil1498-N3)-methyltransferase